MPVYRLPRFDVRATLVSLSETVDWSLAAYGVPETWRTARGEEVTVAVLDTGIEATHPDLADALEDARDFTGSRFGVADRNGHGTHVCGVIAARRNNVGVVGIAPECRLLMAKVLSDDGAGEARAVARGIDWAVERGAQVLSLSLGSPEPSPELAAAIDRAVDRGRFVICAAGNEGRPNSVNYPARWATTIAVGSVDRQGRVSPFSSRGDEVDLCAPGEDILSTWLGGAYARLSGTSMAAPFVAGVAALLLSAQNQPGGPPAVRNELELAERLRQTATDAGPLGRDPNYGYGLINPRSVLAPPALMPAIPAPAGPRCEIGPLRVNGVEGALVFVPRSG